MCVCGQAHLFRELIQTHDIVRIQCVAFRNHKQAKAYIDFIGSKLSERANINQCENPMRYFLKRYTQPYIVPNSSHVLLVILYIQCPYCCCRLGVVYAIVYAHVFLMLLQAVCHLCDCVRAKT